MKLRILSLLVAFVSLVRAAPEKPNVILILADDLGYGDLGCYGQQKIRTPHLDRLAKEGLRLTQAYSGATVCAPSRSVLMTGKHGGHTRVRGNGGGLAQALRPEDKTLAMTLKDAGYRTGLFGKWGLGDVGAANPGLPGKQGFDHFFGFLNQRHAHNSYPSWLWRDTEKVKLKNTVPNETRVGSGVSDNRAEFAPDLFADEASKFIRANRNDPFFLFFATTAPHANSGNGIDVPDAGEYADRDWPAQEKAFAALVSRLDRQVGDLLALLQELGIDDRTIVLFTSDNGPHKEGGHDPEFFDSNGPLRGIKRDLSDGGIRVPTIVRWPGTIAPGTSDAVCHAADLFPTFASFAGAKTPPELDGIDLSPLFLGKSQPALADRFLYWEFHEGGFKQASRWKDWKAIRRSPGAALEIYDVKNDIGEAHDVAAANADVVAAFEAFFQTARSENPDWPVKQAGRRGR